MADISVNLNDFDNAIAALEGIRTGLEGYKGDLQAGYSALGGDLQGLIAAAFNDFSGTFLSQFSQIIGSIDSVSQGLSSCKESFRRLDQAGGELFRPGR